jgi:hypothetical protein
VAFLNLCEFYAASVLMVDDLRKEDPVRAELLAECETMCRAMGANAVAMMNGGRTRGGGRPPAVLMLAHYHLALSA